MFAIHPLLANLTFICAVAYFGLAIVNWLIGDKSRRRLFGVALGFILSIGVWTVLKPFSGLQSFGPPPVLLIAGMLAAICLGVAADYIHAHDGTFSWLEMLRPVAVSPIILAPLIGMVEAAQSMDNLAVVSILLVAFQNGFFWREMIKRARNAI